MNDIESFIQLRTLNKIARTLKPPSDGHTPTEEELLALIEPLVSDERLLGLIEPLIPPPIVGDDGLTPTKAELIALIKPLIKQLIPKVKDSDTPTDEKLQQLIRAMIPEPEPINLDAGKNNVSMGGKDIVELLKNLPEIDKLDISHLRNSVQLISAVGKSNKSGKHDSVSSRKNISGKDRVAGAGNEANNGDNEANDALPDAGSNYILESQQWHGGGITTLDAIGTINDVNKTFTFFGTPKVVAINGIMYRNGHGVTINNSTVTCDNPVGTGGDIYAFA